MTLRLNNLISPQLVLMAKEFEKLQGLTVALKSELRKVGSDASGLRSIATAANASNRALEKASLSASSLNTHLGALKLSAASLGTLPIVPVATSAGRSARSPAPPGGTSPVAGGGAPRVPIVVPSGPAAPRGGGGGGGGGGGAGGGGRHGGFHGGNIHMGPGGIGVGTIGMSAGDAFVPIAISAAAIYGGKALYESAKDLNSEQQRFKLLGLTDAQNAEAFRFAQSLKIFGTTQVERVAAFREAQGVGRESGLEGSSALDFAKLATPILARLDALGKGLDEESAAALHSSNIALLRFDEQAGGLNNPAEFSRLANIGYKLRQSSGGTIDFEQLRAVTAQGGAYTQNSTEKGWAYREPIIQEVKGSAYGTAIATAGSRMFNVLSRTPKNLIEEATRLGLWTPQRPRLNEEDSQLFKDSFEQFYIERVMPLYEKFKLTPNDRIRENAILFGRTGGRVANLVEKQIPSIERSWAAYQKANNIDRAGVELQKSLSGEEKEFESAWTDFKTNWGTTMLPFFTGILKGGASMLHNLAPANEPGKPPEKPSTWLLWLARGLAFLGSKPVKDALHTIGDDKPSESTPSDSRFVAGGKGGGITIHTQINLDGRKVAENVTRHQTRALSAPQTGISGFDGIAALVPAGGVGQ